jgi:hypothetical protein
MIGNEQPVTSEKTIVHSASCLLSCAQSAARPARYDGKEIILLSTFLIALLVLWLLAASVVLYFHVTQG